MVTISIRFRWLFAILLAFSLILPHLTSPGSTLRSGESARVSVDSSMFVKVADHTADAERLSATDQRPGEGVGEESIGEAYSGDYSHETDKLLMLFALHWGRVAASWSGVYSAVPSPDPVFSFERPPKAMVA